MDYTIRIEREKGAIKYARATFADGSVLSLSCENRKLNGNGNSVIAAFSLPPVLTCKPGVPCARDCYAVKMARIHPSCMVGWQRNLAAVESHDWVDAMVALIRSANVSIVRVHVSGDFYSVDYADGWHRVAKALPWVRFLAFTKRDDMDLPTYPDNFRLIASDWNGTRCEIDNVPHSIIGLRDSERPEYAIPCTGNCSDCLACWTLRPDQAVFFVKH